MSLPDALRPWFKFDTWTVRQGLLLLAGIDPHHAACLKLGADVWTSDANPAWAALGHPPRAEWRNDGPPVIHGLRLSVDELQRLGELTRHWFARPEHAGLERAAPAFWLKWAESKQLAPPWLADAQAAGVVPTEPAAAPVVLAAAAPGVVGSANASKATQAANKVTREDGRLRECEAQGVVFDAASAHSLPYGVGAVAESLNITRQSLSADVKAALRRRFALARNGKG